MTLPTNVDDGDLGHLGHHESLHVRFNNSVEVLSGTIAARPAAGAVDAGTLYWATDESKLYRSTGAVWEELAAASTLDDLTDVTLTAVGDNEVLAFNLGSGEWINMTAAEAGLAVAGHTHSGLVTGGDAHDHAGGDGAQIDHAGLANLATGDPHTQYQKESEKGAASGYASLDAGTKVPTAELGSGTADATTFLRGDQTYATPAGGGATFVHKTADESVASSTTLQDDDHLFFTVDANGIYAFEFHLIYEATTGADIKVQWIEPDGTWGISLIGLDTALADFVATRKHDDGVLPLGGNGVGFQISHSGRGVIKAGGTGGTFKLQWAQNTSDATASKILTGSWLSYTKLN